MNVIFHVNNTGKHGMILLVRSDDSGQKYWQAERFLQRKLEKYHAYALPALGPLDGNQYRYGRRHPGVSNPFQNSSGSHVAGKRQCLANARRSPFPTSSPTLPTPKIIPTIEITKMAEKTYQK